MTVIFRSLLGLAFIASVVLLGSCGSGTDELRGSYKVTDVNILASDIEVGESVRVEIFFETKTDRGGDPDAVRVVVRIPASLAFIVGTSRIYDNMTDESDLRAPDRALECGNGDLLVLYDFDDSELRDRALGRGNEFGFRFEAQGLSSDPLAVIEAAADDEQPFGCNAELDVESDEAVEVL